MNHLKVLIKHEKTPRWREKMLANVTYTELLQILVFKIFNKVKQ